MTVAEKADAVINLSPVSVPPTQDAPQTLTGLLESVALRLPGQTALLPAPSGQPITWDTLLERSRRLAGGLWAAGLRPGERLALWLPSRSDYLALCFAAWRLGVMVVSLNPLFERAELDELLVVQRPAMMAIEAEAAGAAQLAVLKRLSPQALSSLRLLIPLGAEDGPDEIAGLRQASLSSLAAAEPLLADLATPETLAVSFNTSGTTRRPKIALHRHQNLIHHLRDAASHCGLDAPGALLLQVMPLCGTYGFSLSLTAIAAGCPQLLMPRFEPVTAARLLREHGATHLFGTNDTLHALLRAVPDPRPFPSLRACGCAVFNPALPGVPAQAIDRGIPLLCSYGSREVLALFTLQRLEDPPELRARPGGFPISPGAEIRIRDEATGSLLPPGQQGMVEVRGPYIMAGYDDDIEAMHAAYTEDGWFRTGDIGQLEPDGSLLFFGRGGDALRMGGVLTHPVEIETWLEEHPTVLGAQVVGVEVGNRSATFAFVLLRPGAVFEAAALRAWCVDGLARFKVPNHFLPLAEFPVRAGANGTKARREELRHLARTALADRVADAARRMAEAAEAKPPALAAAGSEHDQASAEACRAVGMAWERTLGAPPVPGMSFVDASGDSLQLLTLVLALESHVGRRLRLEAFDAEMDAAQMATAFDQALCDGAQTSGELFLLPGAGGETPGIAGIRAASGPIGGMELIVYPGWREMLLGQVDIEAIAAAALAQISTAAPEGPVTLIGYSLGAYIAAEVARQLEKEGRIVRHMVLIDVPPPAPHRPKRHVWTMPTGPRALWWEIHRIRRAALPAEGFARMLARGIGSPMLRPLLRHLASRQQPLAARRQTSELAYWTRLHVAQELRFQASALWMQRWRRPEERLRAPTTLILSEDNITSPLHDLGWGALIEAVTVVPAAGDHNSMLSVTHRHVVMRALQAALGPGAEPFNATPSSAPIGLPD